MGDYYGNGGSGGSGGGANGNGASSSPPKPAIDAGKIFVGGLSWQTSEESLRFHFEQYGTVVSVEVMRDRVTGDPRGFAFVVFGDPSTVDLVMAEEKHEINHKIVDVKRAQARGVAPPSIHQSQTRGGQMQGGGASVTGTGGGPGSVNGGGGGNSTGAGHGGSNRHVKQEEMSAEQAQAKVFVGGIPPFVDRDELRAIFSEFGPVTDAIVMVDQNTQRSRGFGFVTFEHDSNGALKAVEAQPLQIHGRRVEVKLATPRAEQQRRPPPAGPKHVGLRAGQTTSTGIWAGLAVAYGRSGWKAGYGSKAFGKAGWAVQGWDDGGDAPERSGFSFSILKQRSKTSERPSKRPRH